MVKKVLDKLLNKEVILYLFFGGVTTVANIITFKVLRIASLSLFISNSIAWIVAVLIAYFTNRKYVFDSKNDSKKEFTSFIFFRILTLVIDMILMYLFVSLFKIDDLISKIIVNIVVIILNYVFSKLIIFKK